MSYKSDPTHRTDKLVHSPMSTIVEFSPHGLGRHTMLDSMSRPHYSYHEAFAPRNSYYAPEQQQQQSPLQPPEGHGPPRLPPMATMISTAGSAHASVTQNGRDNHYSGGRPGYYSDYATPSPVGQTPPQFPAPYTDPHHMARRPDMRRSPAQSSTASDRSSDEAGQEMRLRQMSSSREHHIQGQMFRPYAHQQSPLSRGDAFNYEAVPTLMKPNHYHPEASSYSSSPPPQQLQHSPSTQHSVSPRLDTGFGGIKQEARPPRTMQEIKPLGSQQDTKPMSISNLLGSDSSGSVHKGKGSTAPLRPTKTEYRITVRQQPFAARSCGFGERDRRVIDPPPIVQLTIHDDSLTPEEHSRKLRHQFTVVHCSIWDEKGTKDMSGMPDDFRQQRRLMGTLVSSPFVGKDENGVEGCFFCFSDLSCRTSGTFRLKFSLVVLEPSKMKEGDHSPIVAETMSEPFQVYIAKDFPGMQASTPLTRRLKEQGCLISIKKGNDKTNPAHGRDESCEDDDDDEDQDSRGAGGSSNANRGSRKRQRRMGG